MNISRTLAATAALFMGAVATAAAEDTRPNILFIISDDHSVNAMGTNDKDTPVPLPGFRRLADEGMVFDRAYCANSLCGPSRACMLTGRHSHNNGFLYNYGGPAFNGSQPTYPKMLQAAGYQTGIVGKWHLISQPTGFDSWQVFPSQGDYLNSTFLTADNQGRTKSVRHRGYVTDVVTNMAITWMESRDKTKPFALIVGHKAPHRNWLPAPRHLETIKKHVAKMTPPATLHDNWENRPEFLKHNRQTVGWDLCNWNDNHLMAKEIPFDVMKEIIPKGQLRNRIKNGEFKGQIPADFDIEKHQPKFAPKTNLGWGTDWIEPGLQQVYVDFYTKRTHEFVEAMRAGKIKTQEDMTEQRWRWYMEDYLGTILSLDESIASLLDYLDQSGLSENTLVIYVGDQSFYLGEHGLYDKRWIFEESMRMPLIMRWKGRIPAKTRSNAMVQNIDYAPTLLEVTGANTPENTRTMEGVSMVPLFENGEAPQFVDRPLYYAFYEQPGEHNAPRHDGIRTNRYTFARIWTPLDYERKSGVRKPENEWLLIDNEKDPQQMRNVSQDPAYADVMKDLTEKYHAARQQYRVPDTCPGDGHRIPDYLPSWGPGENDRIKK
ncbi:MAG: sulfatase-like hydrolase/transferase [Akkermansia sp.]|nr:sulfatase-like hydrolase/transferase [Akkermansia sp.]